MVNWEISTNSATDDDAFDMVYIHHQVYFRGTNTLFAWDKGNGNILWKYTFQDQKAMAGKRVLGNEQGLFSYEEHKSNLNYTTFYHFSFTGKVKWQKTLHFSPYQKTVLLIGDKLFLQGILHEENTWATIQLDVNTGDVLTLNTREFLADQGFNYNNDIYLGGRDGLFKMDSNNPTNITKLSGDFITEMFTDQASNIYYIAQANEANKYKLVIISHAQDAPKEVYTFQASDTGLDPLVANEAQSLYISTDIDEGLKKVDLTTSEILWKYKEEGYTIYKMYALNGYIMAQAEDSESECALIFNENNGQVEAKIKSQEYPSGIFPLTDSEIIVTGMDGTQLITIS
ncbi:hypothetical protein [uncultured Microscilla sp.]|uniref:hypothetical protein n=1 Tax=uncultured Microscilla sp. TaxID=432653 RepID=UPI0026190A96|nr:hypothetical protein [uncultured Microscilla sp.]